MDGSGYKKMIVFKKYMIKFLVHDKSLLKEYFSLYSDDYKDMDKKWIKKKLEYGYPIHLDRLINLMKRHHYKLKFLTETYAVFEKYSITDYIRGFLDNEIGL